ncbi:WD40-like Beta Propeller Repeat [Actinokineospora terrae]|uniref:WD40-like Beta Propeller Repeat n=2 Tax=Actinokineospora terrae TaxID=155974 RepID=A0A1H9WCK2_9PSEU|nr:WD40-like Beta Propeller Repeat [Actinokineospora terrae]
MMTVKTRILVALAAAALLVGAAVFYVARTSTPPAAAQLPRMASVAPPDDGVDRRSLQVLTNGVLGWASATDPHAPRGLSTVRCDRAYYAARTVACLRPVDALVGTKLSLLDIKDNEIKSVPLTGFPNRLKVSASGRMVSWTVFLDGHSYATTGFSTQTGILDTKTDAVVHSLEEFSATVEGKPHQAVDFNYWGVTFTADDNRFYATLGTGGKRYLVEGDLSARTVRTLTANVECPSLSPDGKRIAYKSAIDADPKKGWRLSVMDLSTLSSTPLGETRSVDDQAIWLDDATVAYALQRDDGVNDVWSISADGSGQPKLVVEGANSPSLTH